MSSITYTVMDGLHRKAGFLDKPSEVIGVIHFAITIRESGKVEAGHRKTHGGRYIALSMIAAARRRIETICSSLKQSRNWDIHITS